MSGSRTATGVWKVVYITPHHEEAEAAREVLVKEGFMVRVRPVPAGGGGGRPPLEVLVPRSEAAEATRILQTALGTIYGGEGRWNN